MRLTLPKLPRAKIKNKRKPPLTEEQITELILCSPTHGVEGFVRWCRKWVIIQDKESKAEVPFDLFEGQEKIAPLLVLGMWIIGLKGRQVGWTWLMSAWCLYNMTFRSPFMACVVSQELDYANDFVDRVAWIRDRLPGWMQLDITRRTDSRIEFKAKGHDAALRSVAGSGKAARSITGDLLIFDEAARIDLLQDSLHAALPSIDTAAGQVIVLGTSAGPQGMFYRLWLENYGVRGERVGEDGRGPGNFVPVFVHWSERRGRDMAWYKRQVQILSKISPVAHKYEHPNTPQEAWSFAAGRVYPLFDPTGRNVGTIDLPPDVKRYRAIDWGDSVSAQVTLWIAHMPGPPGFLVHPDCTNTIRELLAYRWDPQNPQRPVEDDDHSCDALRYAVTVFNFTGFVYVYRESYRTDSVDKGWNVIKEIAEIHELSGWEEASPEHRARWWRGRDGEEYVGTVADGSRRKDIALLRANDIPCRESYAFRERFSPKISRKFEKLAGIRMLAILIDGELDVIKTVKISRDDALVRDYLSDLQVTVPHTTSMQTRAAHQMAREIMARRRRGNGL